MHYQNSEVLINALVAADQPFELMEYPNRTHCICQGKGTTRPSVRDDDPIPRPHAHGRVEGHRVAGARRRGPIAHGEGWARGHTFGFPPLMGGQRDLRRHRLPVGLRRRSRADGPDHDDRSAPRWSASRRAWIPTSRLMRSTSDPPAAMIPRSRCHWRPSRRWSWCDFQRARRGPGAGLGGAPVHFGRSRPHSAPHGSPPALPCVSS